jgi:hypothetical protein
MEIDLGLPGGGCETQSGNQKPFLAFPSAMGPVHGLGRPCGEETMTEMEKEEELDALCPECGHAFKVYMDRILDENQKRTEMAKTKCPVCGCGGCTIGE